MKRSGEGKLLATSTLDIGRALGPDPTSATVSSVQEFVRRELLKVGGRFNYDPSIHCMPKLWEGSLALSDAERFCKENGSPFGREENAAVVRAMSQHGDALGSRCYPVGYTAVAIGRWRGETIYALVKVPIVRVKHDEAYLVWPGLRKRHRPTLIELAVGFSLVRHHIASGDYANTSIEFLDAVPVGDTKDRILRSVKESEVEIFTLERLNAVLGIYIEAVTGLLDAGYGRDRPSLTGYTIINPEQPDFWR